jgi:hypothetical protein
MRRLSRYRAHELVWAPASTSRLWRVYPAPARHLVDGPDDAVAEVFTDRATVAEFCRFTPGSMYLPYIVDTRGDTVAASALSQTARTLQGATVVPVTVELAPTAAVRLRF